MLICIWYRDGGGEYGATEVGPKCPSVQGRCPGMRNKARVAVWWLIPHRLSR